MKNCRPLCSQGMPRSTESHSVWGSPTLRRIVVSRLITVPCVLYSNLCIVDSVSIKQPSTQVTCDAMA